MNSRDKGKRGELELANYLKERGYATARRGVQYSGGPGSPDVSGLHGVHIEHKRLSAFAGYKFLDQSKRDSASDELSIVTIRADRREFIVLLTLDDFMELYERSLMV